MSGAAVIAALVLSHGIAHVSAQAHKKSIVDVARKTKPVSKPLRITSPSQAPSTQSPSQAPATKPASSASSSAQTAPATPAQPAGPPAVVAGIPANYDEAKVGTYTLPDPLKMADGTDVRDVKTWTQKRRPEIMKAFETQQFGRVPSRASGTRFDVVEKDTPTLEGAALRRQVRITLSSDPTAPRIDLLVYLPANANGPVPMLLNVSFNPNSLTVDDPAVKQGDMWDREKRARVPANANGRPVTKLNVTPFLAAGFGVATLYYGDIEPDFPEGMPFGIRQAYLKSGQKPAPDDWGAIAAWGWGLSRVLDYFETDKGIDAKRVGIVGISRLGKTVLYAGARDTRFALVIASCSGESGAALSRRNYGETVKHMTARFGYQFAENYAQYGDKVADMPMDAHMLVAAMAPRPLLLQTGDKDFWSDPKGEFLSAVAAAPVYALFGKESLGTDQMPSAGTPILHTLGYYMHDGGHGTIPSDWDVFLKFMQMHLTPATAGASSASR
jgi:hypothetical protein